MASGEAPRSSVVLDGHMSGFTALACQARTLLDLAHLLSTVRYIWSVRSRSDRPAETTCLLPARKQEAEAAPQKSLFYANPCHGSSCCTARDNVNHACVAAINTPNLVLQERAVYIDTRVMVPIAQDDSSPPYLLFNTIKISSACFFSFSSITTRCQPLL